MEQSVNERIIQLKKESGLSEVKFCTKAGISIGTFHNIKSNEKINDKSVNAVVDHLSLNKEWLLTGVGEKYSPNARPVEFTWREEAYDALKKHNATLMEEVTWLRSLVSSKLNFPPAPNKARSRKKIAEVVKLRVIKGDQLGAQEAA